MRKNTRIPPDKVFNSVSSKCVSVAFSGGVRKMLVKKLVKPVMSPQAVAAALVTSPIASCVPQSDNPSVTAPRLRAHLNCSQTLSHSQPNFRHRY